MPKALVIGALGLALGLAAYWAAPGRDGSRPEAAVPAVEPRAARPAPTATAPRTPRAPADERAAEAAAAPDEPFEHENLALVLPPAEDEVELSESPRPPLESPRERIDRLIAAGFSAERAAEIVAIETQQRLSAASAVYRASGTIGAFNTSAAGIAANALRDAIGDADYERYLAATGQPVRVVVGNVEPGSAAENAGLVPGDEIQSYGGRRIFNVRELNALMLEGAAGQMVPATVMRDGQALQLYVTGGPLGIAARSAR